MFPVPMEDFRGILDSLPGRCIPDAFNLHENAKWNYLESAIYHEQSVQGEAGDLISDMQIDGERILTHMLLWGLWRIEGINPFDPYNTGIANRDHFFEMTLERLPGAAELEDLWERFPMAACIRDLVRYRDGIFFGGVTAIWSPDETAQQLAESLMSYLELEIRRLLERYARYWEASAGVPIVPPQLWRETTRTGARGWRADPQGDVAEWDEDLNLVDNAPRRDEVPDFLRGHSQDKPKISLGCDPEFFVIDGLREIVPAAIIAPAGKGEKGTRLGNSDAYVHHDNVMIELNFDGPYHSATTLQRGLHNALNLIKKLLMASGHSLLIEPQATISRNTFDHPSAQEIGCVPDLNIHDDHDHKQVTLEDLGMLRFAGGHMHIGYPEPTKEKTKAIIETLECYLMPYLLYLDNMYSCERFRFYGNPGRHREKSYGMEWRVPSNVWLIDQRVTEIFLHSVERIVDDFVNGRHRYSKAAVKRGYFDLFHLCIQENKRKDANFLRECVEVQLRDLGLNPVYPKKGA